MKEPTVALMRMLWWQERVDDVFKVCSHFPFHTLAQASPDTFLLFFLPDLTRSEGPGRVTRFATQFFRPSVQC